MAARTPAALSLASTVTVAGRNDPLTRTATARNPAFVKGAAALDVFSSASVSTVESGQTITGLTFTVSGLLDGASEEIVVDGKAFTLGANSSGTTLTNSIAYSVTIVSGTATVVLTPTGATSATIQTVVNGIEYKNRTPTR